MSARVDEIAEFVCGRLVAGEGSKVVTRVSHNSRLVNPGDLFVCLVGARCDGHQYIGDAVARGASAILVQSGVYVPTSLVVPTILVPDTRISMAKASAMVCGFPSRNLLIVGVTGTNGKTTTTRLLGEIFRSSGLKTGTIGTLGAELMGEPIESDHTTPESDRLQQLLAAMLSKGCEAVVMEVSSHALDQHRTDCTEFDGGIFTNLTQDHLDYHQNMDGYYAAKRTLFTGYPSQSNKRFMASINIDDEWGRKLSAESQGRVLRYGLGENADIRAVNPVLEPAKTSFQVLTSEEDYIVRLNIGGAFQIYNALAAIAMATGLGIASSIIKAGLESVQNIPGRFESVHVGTDIHVLVDYAHTPDGLLNVIIATQKLKHNRIITLFGCGGDRDRTKRPIMGQIAAAYSDVVVITSDNPRTESPANIIAEIMLGTKEGKAKVMIEPDRRAAIELAISEAQFGDIVILAGKGHETYQIVGDATLPFDDRLVAREVLENRQVGISHG